MKDRLRGWRKRRSKGRAKRRIRWMEQQERGKPRDVEAPALEPAEVWLERVWRDVRLKPSPRPWSLDVKVRPQGGGEQKAAPIPKGPVLRAKPQPCAACLVRIQSTLRARPLIPLGAGAKDGVLHTNAREQWSAGTRAVRAIDNVLPLPESMKFKAPAGMTYVGGGRWRRDE